MRELCEAHRQSKPVIALLDDPSVSDRLTKAEARRLLTGGDWAMRYAEWGMEYDPQMQLQLHEYLFANEEIEWNRLGVFQLVTIRLIVERALGLEHDSTYVQRHGQRRIALPKPRGSKVFHVYCSASNIGCKELMDEVAQMSGRWSSLKLTEDTNDLRAMRCECMLLYLTAQTWTSSERSARLASEVRLALDRKIRVVMAHEMPGVGGQSERHAVEFGTFFAETPHVVLSLGLYDTLASPLKGGVWRQASLEMLMDTIARAKPQEEAVFRLPVAQRLPSPRRSGGAVANGTSAAPASAPASAPAPAPASAPAPLEDEVEAAEASRGANAEAAPVAASQQAVESESENGSSLANFFHV